MKLSYPILYKNLKKAFRVSIRITKAERDFCTIKRSNKKDIILYIDYDYHWDSKFEVIEGFLFPERYFNYLLPNTDTQLQSLTTIRTSTDQIKTFLNKHGTFSVSQERDQHQYTNYLEDIIE